MIPLKKKITISSSDVTQLIQTHFSSLLPSFYEVQSSFLSGIYTRYGSIETANIILCFARNTHLEIIRQRERDLNFNVSLESFWKNFNKIQKPYEKITSIVNITGIPKETVRRKIKNLMELNFLEKNKKNNNYCWNLDQKQKNSFLFIVQDELKKLSNFITKIVIDLDLSRSKNTLKLVEEEIHSQFSFYWYHYLSCQLEWLKWWQVKLKDNDLLLIALQAIIPTLKFIDKNSLNQINLDNIFKIIGQVDKGSHKDCSISATSISDVTGIPRATCIRKLDKLVLLGLLTRQNKSKRYSVNQSIDARTKNILSKENVGFTIKTFSEYIAIILNSLMHRKS